MPLNLLESRHRAKHLTRLFFHQRNYLEVDTPVLVNCPGMEKDLQYFSSKWLDFRACSHKLWLRSSPELHMKQLLSQGYEKIYQLGPVFRNGGELASWHQPEFLMLEWYEKGLSFSALMKQSEELIFFLQEGLLESYPSLKKIDLPTPFVRLSLKDAFLEFSGIELIDQDPDLARKAREKKIISVQAEDDFETSMHKILLERIEPQLKRLKAVVLYDYPASQAALARVEKGVAKRFEIYLEGVEVCNGYDELLSSLENKKRAEKINLQREKLGYELLALDQDFIACLDQIKGPCSGNALGFERVLAVLLGLHNLASLNPFFAAKPFSLERSSDDHNISMDSSGSLFS